MKFWANSHRGKYRLLIESDTGEWENEPSGESANAPPESTRSELQPFLKLDLDLLFFSSAENRH